MANAQRKLTWLALGDSYTIGESVKVAERFPNQTVALLKQQNIVFAKPTIIASTGHTTANLLQTITSKPPKQNTYSIVTLLIGVNNQYQNLDINVYKAEFEQLLTYAILKANSKPSHVIVLSIPDWGYTPFAKGKNKKNISAAINRYNTINKQLSKTYKVGYVNITPLTRLVSTNPKLTAKDTLHPSGSAYAAWATLLAPIISNIITVNK